MSKLVGVNKVHSLCRSGVPSPSPSSEGASPALASSAPSSALKPDTSSTPTPVTRQVFCEMCESSVSSASSHSSSAQHMLDDYIGDLMLHFGNTLNISFKSKYYYEFCCKVPNEVETIITGSSEGSRNLSCSFSTFVSLLTLSKQHHRNSFNFFLNSTKKR